MFTNPDITPNADFVVPRLSQMILDKVLDGVLDQGRGCLVLFDSPEKEEGYEDAVKMIAEVGRVVESLWGKAIRA